MNRRGAEAEEVPPTASEVAAGTRGRALAIGVISFVMLAHVTTEYAVTRDRGRLFFKVVSIAIGVPLLIGILSAGFRWATRRRWGTLRVLLAGISIAGGLGAGLHVAMRVVASYLPALRPHGGAWDMPHVMLVGLVLGLTNFALWVLAFFVPFAAEEVHVRSLEADKLRLEAEKLRTAAELAQLRAHLEPHFLLNTLNAIAGLVTDEPQDDGDGAAASRLVCTIEDNGPGLTDGGTRPGAFGLVAVRRRLALKYADAASLRLEASPSGTRSIVELPWRHTASTPMAS